MATGNPELPDDCLSVTLAEGALITRVHHLHHSPLFYGPKAGMPPGNRFDAPAGEFGTLYAARGLTGAFVETMLRRATRIVAQRAIDQRGWAVLRLKRDCELVMLHGPGLVHHGVTNDICAGDDYRKSQLLALDLFERYGVDGIAYRARHNNDEVCYAINERVKASDLVMIDQGRFRDHPRIVDRLLRDHGAVRDPCTPVPPLGRIP